VVISAVGREMAARLMTLVSGVAARLMTLGSGVGADMSPVVPAAADACRAAPRWRLGAGPAPSTRL